LNEATVPNKEFQKKICRRCGGIGHVLVYEAPHVKRRYCDCEVGKERKEFIDKQIKTKDTAQVWELFSL